MKEQKSKLVVNKEVTLLVKDWWQEVNWAGILVKAKGACLTSVMAIPHKDWCHGIIDGKISKEVLLSDWTIFAK